MEIVRFEIRTVNRDVARTSAPSQDHTPRSTGSSRYGYNGEPLSRPPVFAIIRPQETVNSLISGLFYREKGGYYLYLAFEHLPEELVDRHAVFLAHSVDVVAQRDLPFL